MLVGIKCKQLSNSKIWRISKNSLDASEDPGVEVDESCDRDDAGEDKSAPVLVIADNVEQLSIESETKNLTEYNLDLFSAQSHHR